MAGTFTYNPPAGTVLNAGNGQNLHVAFMPTETANYNSASKDVTINVLKATPTATLAVSNSPQIYNGSPKAATVSITTSSVPGTVANILTGGATTQTAAGSYAVTADFVPTDSANYNNLTGLLAGNFNVIFNFTGFFRPIDNLPVVNTVNAGSSVPIKFSLSGNQGMNIFAPGYPKSVEMTCGVAPADFVDEIATPGSSGLSYDPGTDQYHYVWKTDKAWGNTCRRLAVKLSDGQTYFADFKFKK